MKNSKSQLIDPRLEKILKQNILKDLENKGRKNYDLPHTKAVVYWLKELIQRLNNPNLDSQVLITAAYAHDWGYAGLFAKDESRSLDKIISSKKLHMQRGAAKIEQLLYQRAPRLLTDAQIQRVIHLVSVHDKVKQLKAEDALLLMEADTLGMLDADRVTPTLSPQDEERFMKNSIEKLRYPRFVHEEAKEIASELIELRKNYQKSNR